MTVCIDDFLPFFLPSFPPSFSFRSFFLRSTLYPLTSLLEVNVTGIVIPDAVVRSPSESLRSPRGADSCPGCNKKVGEQILLVSSF